MFGLLFAVFVASVESLSLKQFLGLGGIGRSPSSIKKDLLALSRSVNRGLTETPEQNKVDRYRGVPYHTGGTN